MDSMFLLQLLPAPRMFGLDGQVVAQMSLILLSVCILAFIMSTLLYKPVLRILQDRKARVQKEVDTADDNKAKAISLKKDYETVIKSLDREKYDILDVARKTAAEQSKEKLAKARKEVETQRLAMQKEIAAEQERAEGEIKQAVLEVSALMVAKFTDRTIDKNTQEQLFKEAIAEWGGTV